MYAHNYTFNHDLDIFTLKLGLLKIYTHLNSLEPILTCSIIYQLFDRRARAYFSSVLRWHTNGKRRLLHNVGQGITQFDSPKSKDSHFGFIYWFLHLFVVMWTHCIAAQCCCILGIFFAVEQYSNIKDVLSAPAYSCTHKYYITVMVLLSILVEQKKQCTHLEEHSNTTVSKA